MSKFEIRDEVPQGQRHFTVTKGIRGWFAVEVWWNPDQGGFWEPYQSSDWSTVSKSKAWVLAAEWAQAEDLPILQYKPEPGEEAV